jgi:uncharacterized protein YjiS (DUF1127 family)
MVTIQLTIALDGKPIHLSNGFGRTIDRFREWRRRARSRRELSELGDDVLGDLGLTRVDAAREASKPFWRP